MKVRNIIVFMIVFLMSTFMNVSTIHAESGSRKGSIQIVYKGRNELNQEVNLSDAKFSIPFSFAFNSYPVAIIVTTISSPKSLLI